MRSTRLPILYAVLSVVLSACETAPQKSGPMEDVEHDQFPVTMEAVTLYPPEATVTASGLEKVFHVVAKNGHYHEYYVMLGPKQESPPGSYSQGQLTIVDYAPDPNDPRTTYPAPAWEVEHGYARIFGWYPIGTAGQVVAGGTGTSFILQVEGSVVRVFLVNPKGGDSVTVRDTTNETFEIVNNRDSFALFANGQLSKESLNSASTSVKDFVNWVESRAAAVGLP